MTGGANTSAGGAGPRVVSLLPSATEILASLGGVGLLVGRSHECDTPAGLGAVPVLTGQRTTGTGPAEIDRQVREQVTGGQSLYTLDEDLLCSLAPDVILTQDLCSVCSIDLRAVRRVVDEKLPGTRVVSLNPSTVEDILDDVVRVGGAAGLEDRGVVVAAGLRERMFAAGEFVNAYEEGPVVGFLEWTDPLFGAGHWNVQLIERAGGRHPWNEAVARPGTGAAAGPQMGERVAGPSVRMSAEALVAGQPEWLVITPCGVALEAAVEMAGGLVSQAWWRDLPAVRKGRVAVVDGQQMFSRPGPRVVDAYEWLVGWLQDRPGVMPPGFPWKRLG